MRPRSWLAPVVLLPFILAGGLPPASGATGPGEGPVVWPVASRIVLVGFDPPAAAWEAGHRGVDLASATGDVVRSMTHGRLDFVGVVAGKPVIAVALPDGRRLTYEPVRAILPAGREVRAGQAIGYLAADGGHCGGRFGCLHVGLIGDGAYRDPLSLLRRPIVLKPVPRSRTKPRPGVSGQGPH